MNTASSRDSFIIPATKCWPTCDRPYGPAFAPSAAYISGHVLGDVPEAHVEVARTSPVQRWSGLAMNVMPQPLR